MEADSKVVGTVALLKVNSNKRTIDLPVRRCTMEKIHIGDLLQAIYYAILIATTLRRQR